MRWLLVVCWMGVLFALCATPSFASPFAPIDDLLLRTLAHVTVYAVWILLVYGALRRPRARRPHVWLLALLIATRYAGSDEWHHTCVPGREGTVRDGGIDAVGIVGAWALASRTRLKAMLPRWLAEGW